MNERFPEELLSAYLDGEASAEETARVDAWLASSAEAREELDEIRRVTKLLRSLPQESPGSEFVTAVMRQAEQAVLIPPMPAPAVARSPRRGWVVAAAGLAVAAAVLLLLVPAFFAPQSADQLARNETGSRQNLPFAAHADRSGSGTRMAAEADSPSELREPEALSFSDGSTAARQPAPSERPAFSAAPEAAPQPAAGDEMRLGGRAGGEDLKRFGRSMQNLADWNAVRVGDVVPYFSPPGDRAAVVRLTVVDVRKAAGDLQVLLAKNSVLPVADEEEAAETEQPDVRPEIDEQLRQLETRDGLLALYVESTDAQLLSALEAIEADEQFVDFVLEPPVELEGVELAAARKLNEQKGAPVDAPHLYRKETLGEAVAANRMLHYKAIQQQSAPGLRENGQAAGSGRSERALMERDVAKRQPDEPRTVRGPAELARSKNGVATSPAAPAEALEADLSLNAFQMLVNVSSEPNRFRQTPELLQQRARLHAAQEPAAPQPFRKQTAQTGPPPVRVIFIFQGREDHTQDG